MEIRYPWRTGRPHSGPPPCWASQCGSQASAPFSPSLMSPLKQKNVIPFFDYVFHVKWFSDVVNSICAFGKKKWTRKLFWTTAKHINLAYLHLLLLDIYRLRLLYYITFQESPYKGYPPFLAPCWDILSPTYQSWDQKIFPNSMLKPGMLGRFVGGVLDNGEFLIFTWNWKEILEPVALSCGYFRNWHWPKMPSRKRFLCLQASSQRLFPQGWRSSLCTITFVSHLMK